MLLRIEEPLSPGFDQSARRPLFVRALTGTVLAAAGICINKIPWYFNSDGSLLLFVLACFLVVLGVGVILAVIAIATRSPDAEKPANTPLAISWKGFYVALLISALCCSCVFLFFYRINMLFETGADRLGQCESVETALMSTGLIPSSAVSSSHGAIGCWNERYGIFFRNVNNVSVYGITSSSDQDRVLRKLSELATSTDLAPTKVFFYEKENWIEQRYPNGTVFGRRGPENLVRIAVVR